MLVPISYFDNEYLYLIAIVFERKTSSLHTLSGNKRLWLIACFISQNKKKKKKESRGEKEMPGRRWWKAEYSQGISIETAMNFLSVAAGWRFGDKPPMEQEAVSPWQ